MPTPNELLLSLITQARDENWEELDPFWNGIDRIADGLWPVGDHRNWAVNRAKDVDIGEGGAGGLEGWRVCANDDRKLINNITG